MDEEKVCNDKNDIKSKKINDKNLEIKEIRLEKMSPGFNLVSLKARHRLNELKNLFTKAEYREYIRKCKNMYSISSSMNNKYSISDLYHREKYDINDIVSVYNKIDNKLDSKKIKLTRIKKDKAKNKTSINFFQNISNMENFKSNSNILNKNRNEDISTIFNSNKINYTSYDGNNRSNFNINNLSINNQMSKTSYEKINKKSNILNYKTHNLIRNFKNIQFSESKTKNFSSTAYPSLFSNHKNNNIKNHKKEIKINIKLSKLNRSNSDFGSIIYNLESKKYPLSCKNNSFNVTKFGAIIYNNSMFRNKNLENFVPKYYELPIMYKNIKI